MGTQRTEHPPQFKQPDKNLLNVDSLSVEFKSNNASIKALANVSFSISSGEVMGLVGESGSGKSTSALAILGLLPKSAQITGSAFYQNKDLLRMDHDELRSIRGAKIGMVFQDPFSSLNPVQTIGKQISEAIRVHEDISKQTAQKRAIELLSLVGIPRPAQRLNDYPHQFSGGMRQRVMLSIAIACKPSLLIADEPTTALDVTIQAQIVELLVRLRHELGLAVLLITHNLGLVAGLTDRVVVIYAGRVVETASTNVILDRPKHPYTQGLIKCVPRIDRPKINNLPTIPGIPPDPTSIPIGCPFRPRCDFAIDECSEVIPPLSTAEEGHFVACFVQPETVL